mmetsp:Transcript_30492/g.60333  ORF Transcript_30492/g.60333 Transcript_30492/m.60333 type:complete len:169 (+) Transcript_30492:521-1027(+)
MAISRKRVIPKDYYALALLVIGTVAMRPRLILQEVVVKATSYREETNHPRRVISVSELTRSHNRNVECPEPLVPLYDKIVDPLPDDKQQIPRSIHLAWIRGYRSPQSRCISSDMMEIALKWMEQFPSYSLYFHDDEAVDMLFDQKKSRISAPSQNHECLRPAWWCYEG